VTYRTPAQSRVEMTQIVMPTHMNFRGSLFGGMVVQWIDICAAVAAMRHARGNAVTASIDRIDFLSPISQGDIVILQAQVNAAYHSSMEIGCRVESEDPKTGERRYCTKAYLTFVALTDEGETYQVPELQPETDTERRRQRDAGARKAERLATRARSLPSA
jgi:acyl-CoA hydrolase